MLPIPNLPSSGNDNDSDDFAIINTPSPQPMIIGDNSNTNKFIQKIKESEEIDDFEHLQINKPPLMSDNDTSGEQSEFDLIDIPSNTNNIASNPISEFQVIQESQSDDDDDIKQRAGNKNDNNESVKQQSKESGTEIAGTSISMPEDKIIESPVNQQEISPMITSSNNWSPSISAKTAPTIQTKSTINLTEPESKDFGEQKLEILRLSPSQSPSIRSDSASPKGIYFIITFFCMFRFVTFL